MQSWELAALVIGILALVIGILAFIVAVPPFIQMISGRPKISLEFDTRDVESGSFLTCQIFNRPPTSRILRILNITKMTAEDIMATFSIEEYGTQRVVFPGAVPKIITHGGPAAQRISLPASAFPAIFGIVTVETATGKVAPCDDTTRITLEPGKYYARVEVAVGGKFISKQRAFVVTEDHPFTYWAVN